ncbi:hypothetical protein ACIQCG_00730 [Streptomyces noursei]
MGGLLREPDAIQLAPLGRWRLAMLAAARHAAPFRATAGQAPLP